MYFCILYINISGFLFVGISTYFHIISIDRGASRQRQQFLLFISCSTPVTLYPSILNAHGDISFFVLVKLPEKFHINFIHYSFYNARSLYSGVSNIQSNTLYLKQLLQYCYWYSYPSYYFNRLTNFTPRVPTRKRVDVHHEKPQLILIPRYETQPCVVSATLQRNTKAFSQPRLQEVSGC